jgi:hypothetical protein
MKKLLGIVVLGLLLFIPVSADEIDDEMIYLKCEGHPAVTFNYILIPKAKVILVSDEHILLDVTADTYNFEFFPVKGKLLKLIVSIDRFTGKLTQTMEAGSKENKATSTLYGNCIKKKF